MNKKLFSWKALAGVVLFAAMTMGLQSCTQTPDPEPEPAPGPAPAAPVVIDGTAITFSNFVKLSDINAVLEALSGAADAVVNVSWFDGANVVTKAITCKAGTLVPGKTYDIVINNKKIKVTAGDYALNLSYIATTGFENTDGKFNVSFTEAFETAPAARMWIVDEALDHVDINFAPMTIAQGLTIYMPWSTATISGDANLGFLELAMDYATIRDKYMVRHATWLERRLSLKGNTTVGVLYYWYGGIVVDENASINALGAWEYGGGDSYIHLNGNGVYSEGNFNIDNYELDLNYADGTPYYLHNVYAPAGDGSTTRIYFDADDDDVNYLNDPDIPARADNPIKNLTIEDNEYVYISNKKEAVENKGAEQDYDTNTVYSHIYIDNIIGLGKGNAIVYLGSDMFAFRDVKSIKNITYKWTPTSTSTGYSTRIYAPMESCTVENFSYIIFMSTVQNIKKDNFKDAASVYFNVDARNGATAYGFNYDSCEMPANCRLGVNDFETQTPILDADGNEVWYTVYEYATCDANGNLIFDALGDLVWAQTKNFNDVPLTARKLGLVWIRIVQAQENDVRVSDMTITIGLTGTKIGGNEITKNSEWDSNPFQVPNSVYGNWTNITNGRAYYAEMTYKYNIGGVLYRITRDNVWGKWFFVTTR